MKKSAITFEEYFELCEEAFDCKNSPPGSKRVTFLKSFSLFSLCYVLNFFDLFLVMTEENKYKSKWDIGM